MSSYFSTLTSEQMAELIGTCERSICLAAPGLQPPVAEAIAAVAARIGPELVVVCVDFDERVLRMGFGELDAIKTLQAAGVDIKTSPGLRMGLLVVDDAGYVFTPTALLLEAEDHSTAGLNAMRLSGPQAKEAMAQLSPAAKAVAIALSKSEEERRQLEGLEPAHEPAPVAVEAIEQTDRALQNVPVTKFDVARRVRVYSTLLQYVEIELRNASIDKKRVAIPAQIQSLGGGDELDGRLKSSFDLIEKGSSISSKPLNDRVAQLRKDFTPALGKKFGRALLKSAKPAFERRLGELREELTRYQQTVREKIQAQLDSSREAIVEFYYPLAKENPPDAAVGLFGSDVREWLRHELDRAFPKAQDLIKKMDLDVSYKDVTIETLEDPEFLEAVRAAFPGHNWEKAHSEYNAVGEASGD